MNPAVVVSGLLMFLASTALAQSSTAARPYAAGPLTADDFAGAPPENHGALLASTNSGIEHTFQYRGMRAGRGVRLAVTQLEAKAMLYRAQSWNTAPRDTRLMEHEQGHFDITELYARKWQQHADRLIKRKALGGQGLTQDEAIKAAKTQIDAELASINKAWQQEQVLYDKETDHGRQREAQARWRERLDRELAAASRDQ